MDEANQTYGDLAEARAEMMSALRKQGVSADLLKKIEDCHNYLVGSGMGKTMMVAQNLIYYIRLAYEERSAVAALGHLVEDEDAGSGPRIPEAREARPEEAEDPAPGRARLHESR